MGSEWTFCTLSKISDIQTGPFGSQLHASDYVSDGIPSIMPQNISDNRINENGIARITSDDAQRLEKYRVKTGDIVYSRRGDVELRALVREKENGWLCGTGCLRVRIATPEVDSKFTSFYLSTSWSRAWIVQHAHGATMPNLNTSILGEVPFAYPDIRTQHSIAATLSCLDDKIELNNRIIANLEAQAQAIFKSWFVDYEPFQDGEFEESELGLIPKGWRVGTLKDICHYSNDRVAVDTLNDETYISTENMLSNKQGFVKATSLPTTAYTTAYHAGDVLISNIRPYFKKIVYCYGEGGCSTDVICFVANNGIPSEYLFHLLYSDMFFDFMVGGSKGTKMPRGDKQQLVQYRVVQPDDKWLAEFKKIAQPILLQSYMLKQENERLAQTRDALLPKLMSGEIEVPVEG